MATNPLRKDFLRIQKDIDKIVGRVETGIITNYAGMLRDLRSEVADSVAKYGKDNTLTYADMQRCNRLKKLNTNVDGIIKDYQGNTFRQSDDAFKKIAVLGFEESVMPLSAVAGITAPQVTGKMVQEILNRPYSGLTTAERAILRTRDLGVRVRASINTNLIQQGGISDFNDGIKKVVQKDLVKTVGFVESAAHSIGQEGIQYGIKSLKVEGIRVTKTWVTAGDDAVRDAHEVLDGQTVEGDELFEIPSGEWAGYTAEGPGLFGEPALDYGCRCWLVGGVETEK